jgi:cyclopropane fatty-acyl-phospholipid synthase-like methyltransferase
VAVTGFDAAYACDTAPWDLGRPQAAMVQTAEAGLVRGRVLDIGCGTGELACHLAARGHPVVGIDAAPTAVASARRKAMERGLDVEFRVADALDPPGIGRFDTVVDSGLFHVFGDAGRARYVDVLRSLLGPGGHALVLCFADTAPGRGGPRRVSPGEIREAFAERDGWTVEWVRESVFETRGGTVPAYLSLVTRR